MSNKLISVNNLKKSFGGLKAVDVDELHFEEGELTSIIGPNGAGKTTFFDLISGFQNADSGEIFLKEKNIRNDSNEITLFKSVGTALEDLAAAQVVIEKNLE